MELDEEADQQPEYELQHIVFTGYIVPHMGIEMRNICIRGYVNNKDAELSLHPHRLISAFFTCIRFFKNTVSKLATSQIIIF